MSADRGNTTAEVFCVTYGQCEPAEVKAIYTSFDEAQKHADALNADTAAMPYEVTPWVLAEEFDGYV